MLPQSNSKYTLLCGNIQIYFIIFAKELFETMEKKADRRISLVSKSLPIVYFPFLKP